MKFSLSLFPLDKWSSWEEINAAVRRAEELGFDSLGFSEHLFTPVSGPERTPSSPSQFWVDNFAFVSSLAAGTERIRFILSALIVPYRHPMHTAKGIATVDWISGGRLDVTTGVGWSRPEFDVLGVPFKERGARTDEYLRAMISLWTQEYPRFHGKFVSFDDLVTAPQCVQKPHVPLLIGGNNERAYRRVLEFGAGWAPMLAGSDEITQGLKRIHALADEEGREVPALRVFTRIEILGGNTAVHGAASTHADLTPSSTSNSDRNNVQETLDVIGQYVDAGVTEIGLSFPWTTPADYLDRLEWFASEVMPHT